MMSTQQRPRRLLAGITLVLSLSLSLTGCSFLFVSGPPDNHETLSKIDCTKGRGWPITDAIVGGVFLADGVLAATGGLDRGSDNAQRTSPSERVAFTATFAGIAALLGTSAYYGFSRAGACRTATEALVARHGLPAPLPEPGSLLMTRSGKSFIVAPDAANITFLTGEGEVTSRLADITWLAGSVPGRARLAGSGRVLAGSVKNDVLRVDRVTRHGREPMTMPAQDVAFFLGTTLTQESGSLRVEDTAGQPTIFYSYRDADPLNGAFDVDLVPDRWVGGVSLSQPSYPRHLLSGDDLDVHLSVEGASLPEKDVLANLHLTFEGGSVQATTPVLHPALDAGQPELSLHFDKPFRINTLEIHGTSSVLIYLAQSTPETLASGLLRIERTLSNLVRLPMVVEPSSVTSVQFSR